MNEYDIQRRQTRRRWGRVSFTLVCVVGIGLIGFGLSSDMAADRVDKLMGVIGLVFAAWTAIVMTYMGVSSYESNGTRLTASKE
jgi:hypothetical protein